MYSLQLFPGKIKDDVEITLMEIETKEIGQETLMWYFFISYDKPSRNASNTNEDNEVEEKEDYIPKCIYDISRDNPKSGWVPKDVSIMTYFGQYRESDMSLRAVTHLKYHVSNVSLDWDGIEVIRDEEDNAVPRYYNLQGLEVPEPEPGKMYIIREGSKSRKAIFR